MDGKIATITSVATAIGGSDTITAADGDTTILGGAGSDTIDVGVGNHVILGDSGKATFAAGVLVSIESIDPEIGGDDIITAKDGNVTVIGGAGADTITLGKGTQVVLGDSGSATFDGGKIATVTSTATNVGGNDTITAADGDTTILGGAGADIIDVGAGNHVILGDSGKAVFSAGKLVSIESIDPGVGGDDTVTAKDGNVTVIGGAGADKITLGKGTQIVLGDSGSATFDGGVIATVTSTATDVGGNDTITATEGDTTILGGAGADTIKVGAGYHVILGDSGRAVFRNGRAQRIESITPEIGGDDIITAQDGESRIIGGAGSDTITTGAGNHVILGDSGEADFTVTVTGSVTTSVLARIATTAPAVGGADTITFGSGNNVVLGGAGGDTIKGGDKGAVILGDNGIVTFDALGRIQRALSFDTAIGGDDSITVGNGDNVVLGGTGRDTITIGDGNNVVLGDSGQADFEAGLIVEIASISPEVGDRDTISLGSGRNTVVGGAGGDTITAGIRNGVKVGTGTNVILGDAGHARFTADGLPILVETTYDNVGGDDTITVGDGVAVILGGSGGDIITAGNGRSVVLGDNGQASFDAQGRVLQAATTAATAGGRDEITLGDGGSVVIGGVGADKILTGSGADVILGDNGSVVFANGVLVSMETMESTFGGGDLIDAGEGDNVVFGGVGADDITTGAGLDVILGDDGLATFAQGKLVRVTTKNESVAGDDTIRAGDGDNVVLGGSGSDTITTGSGADLVFGDNGAVDFLNGVRLEALSERAGGGGRDTISTGAGADLIIGGLGSDVIDAGKDDTDDDIVFGDNGHITFDALGRVVRAETIDPTLGGDDRIEAGAGANLILGGAGSDTITTGAGADIVLGDNGFVTFTGGIRLEAASDPTGGARDIIVTGAGADLVIGGLGGDSIDAGKNDADADIVFGDNGHVTFDALGRVIRAETTDPTNGGDDEIDVGGGDNIVLGGAGSDTITAGSGADIVLGDNGFVTFADGIRQEAKSDPFGGARDTISTGAGADLVIGGLGGDVIDAGKDDTDDDIVFGDNGHVIFDALGRVTLAQTTDPTDGGDDRIEAGAGANLILGGAGSDTIVTGAGADIVLGDNGSVTFAGGIRLEVTSSRDGGAGDTITTGAGADVVIGGLGSDTIDAGKDDADADIVFGDNGHVTFDSQGRVKLAESLDMGLGDDDTIAVGGGDNVVIGGTGSDTITALGGNDVVLGDDGRATFESSGHVKRAESFDLGFGGNDTIRVGAGDNVVIAGAGNDTVVALGGNDAVLGDGGYAEFEAGIRVAFVSVDAAGAGNDRIDAGEGDNVVLGGSGSDTITTGAGADIVLGDNGAVRFAGGIRQEVTSDRTGGAGDTITTGAGADLVLGGLGGDTIDAGKDDTDADIVFGDNGHVTFDAIGGVIRAESFDAGFGGNDDIKVGGGDNLVIGGTGADTIVALGGSDVIIGDNGHALFAAGVRIEFASTETADGGDDRIDAGDGDNLVIGGSGSDTITTGSGGDIVLGDNGLVGYALGIRARVVSDRNGGARDSISTGAGADVVLGGLGGDTIDAGKTDTDADIVLGDNGEITFDGQGRVALVQTTDPTLGGDDEIDAGAGDNLVFGGAGADTIVTGAGADIVLGDNGSVRFTGGIRAEVIGDRMGGAGDRITTGAGADVVLGGIGSDLIDAGKFDTDVDVVFGDNGHVTFDAQGRVKRAESLDAGFGDDDTIAVGGGDNIVIGGTGSDIITALGGNDILIGDQGYALFEGGVRMEVATTETSDGGNDRIDAGDGDNVVLGGSGSDTIVTGAGADIVLGDNGTVSYALGIRARVVSDRNGGARDSISTGAGADVVLGGLGADSIDAGKDDADADIVFGDDGQIVFDAQGRVKRAESLDIGFGDDDEIQVGGGDNLVIGGAGSDVITALGGNDVILGDNGYAVFEQGVRVEFASIDTTDAGNDRIDAGDGDNLVLGGSGSDTITTAKGNDIVLGDNGLVRFELGIRSVVQSSRDGGTRDVIKTGAGADVVLGGLGADSIDAGKDDGDADIVLGDNGRLTFDALGRLKRAESLDPTFGDDDEIQVGGGDNVVIGGAGSDTITALAGNDVILGDNGYALFEGGVRVEFASTDPDDGARDIIKGGDGDNVVIGGVGSDDITTGAGADIVLGDMGVVAFENGLVHAIYTTDERRGAGDVIRGGDGDNIVFGGAGRDEITTGSGSDLILGDFGEASFTDGHLVRVASLDPTRGDDDTITAGDGDNIILGGFGSDTITAGAGADLVLGDNGLATFRTDGRRILVRTTDVEIGAADTIRAGDGDNLVLGGADADAITTGKGADVILGDFGAVTYDAAGLLQQILSTDTGLGGNDTIAAGDGSDIILGGFGSDTITANDGAKTVLGDSGQLDFAAGVLTLVQTLTPSVGAADTIRLGTGRKLVIGGAGGDIIEGQAGDAIVLGDAGLVRLANGSPVHVESTDFAVAGDDTVTLGATNAVVLGGSGSDKLTLGAGRSVVLGDNGSVDLDDQARPTEIASIAPEIGGRDVIAVGDGGSVVLGGFGADTITTGSGSDVILGDNGAVTLSAWVPVFVRTTDPTVGEADEIRAGEGDNVVLGGAGGDSIVTGSGRDTVLGDHGQIRFDAKGLIARVESLDTGLGGDDTIEAGAGDNLVIAGVGADKVTTLGGNDIVLGDNGVAAFAGGVRVSVATLAPADGGKDTLILGDGDNLVLGGAEADAITTGKGADVILGDFGTVTYDAAGLLQQILSTDTGLGGNDTIAAGDGSDIILGGFGSDTITANDGAKTVLGDSGQLDFAAGVLTLVQTLTPSVGAADTIRLGTGRKLVIGGAGGDIIEGQAGDAIVLGDAGLVRLANGSPVHVESTDFAVAGDDTVTLGATNAVVLGGSGSDKLTLGAGRSVVLGDNGSVDLDDQARPTEIASIAPEIGGRDVIAVGDGGSVVLGGFGADTITTGSGSDVILGDNGAVTLSAWVPVFVRTTDPTVGEADEIRAGEGDNVVLGGAGGDSIVTGSGRDTVLGDHGQIRFDAKGLIARVESLDTGLGGDDTIEAGAGDNLVIAGVGADKVTTLGGNDIVLGDNGVAAFAGGVRVSVATLAPADGGKDTLILGDGDNLVLGGTDADAITTGKGADVILGDFGAVTYDAAGLLQQILSTDTGLGGDDTIEAGAGDNLVLGGFGADTITTGSGADVILGDSGEVLYAAGRLIQARSLDAGIGGRDAIKAGEGANIVIGGMDADTIETGSGRDVVLGDSGLVRLDADGLAQVSSTDTALGGDDVIDAGAGDNLVIGGFGADTLTTGSGADIVLGDSGEARFTVGVIASVTTIDAASGAGDTIRAGDGDNLVFGGLGGDTITTGAGSDAIVGDHGRATFSGGVMAVLETIDPTAGGDDRIVAGDGDNLVFGGVGADRIVTGAGADMILGDNGRADLTLVGGRAVIRRLASTDPLAGGEDHIEAGGGNDYVAGGTGADVILGGDGHDVLFGDHMLYDLALPANQRAASIFTAATDGGGNDIIDGGAGDDFLYGQQGDDQLSGGDGDDDITGGHNVLGGADGNDTINGGAGADVILGDNGVITRNVLVDDVKSVTWQRNPGVFADTVMRDVLRFDLIDFIGGNDAIAGGAGDDRIFGQMGDDLIYGEEGSDEIVGGLGRDTIDGGAGVDYILGDEGRIVRAYGRDGSAVLNSDGTWHRDVVLEEIGTVTAAIATDSQTGAARTADLAEKLAQADLVLAVGARDGAGVRLTSGEAGTWATSALTVSLARADDDIIDGGDGNDVLFGQRGNDTLFGGAGDDLIYGDRASNLAETTSDKPTIVNAIRLIGAAPETGLALPLGGEVVVPAVNLLPGALSAGAPRIELYPSMAGVASDIAGSDPIRRADGAVLTVYASMVPSLYGSNGVLAGNDIINGGAGNDTIYGDNSETYTLDVTAYAALNGQIDKVSASLTDLLGVFATLSRGVDLLQGGPGRTISYGNDTISGGEGDDFIVGDAARTIVQGAGPLRNLSADDALTLSDFLSDMRTVISDLAMTGRAAQAPVTAKLEAAAQLPLNQILAYGLPESMRTNHTLLIGNDTIDAGAGDDLVVGDTLVMLQPGVARGLAVSDPAKAADAASVEAAVTARAAERFSAMQQHWLADFPVDLKSTALHWLVTVASRGDAFLSGNDRIDGGDGNDLLIGDTGFLQMPAANAAQRQGVTAASLAEDRAQVEARVLGNNGSGLGGDLDPWTRSAWNALAGNVLGWRNPLYYGLNWDTPFGFSGPQSLTAANRGWIGAPRDTRFDLQSVLFDVRFILGVPDPASPASGVYAGAIKAGEDIITGGAGNNRIFGAKATLVPTINATGEMVGPNSFTVLLPTDLGMAQGSFTPALFPNSIGVINTAGAGTQFLNFHYGVAVGGQWGTSSLASYLQTYGGSGSGTAYGLNPLLPAPQYGAPQGPSTGADQISEGDSGIKVIGFHKKKAIWTFDAGVTLPALSATVANTLTPTSAAGRPAAIAAVAHTPLRANDVIRSIEGGDIVLRGTDRPPASAPAKYATWVFDEAKGSLVEQAKDEDDILFLAKRFGDPTLPAK